MKEFFKGFKEKFKIGKLFYDNRFTAFFSLVCAFVMWVLVSSSSTESIPVTISDIPINITLSDGAVQDGLQIFSGQDITANVEVTGSRLVVGQLTKNDIQVTAPQAASTIMSPGNYTLELSAKKAGMISDYSIASDVKPSVITVMVDRLRETELEIQSEINFTAKEGYFVGGTTLSSPKVKISGPETEVSKVKKVLVKGEVPGEVSETVNMTLPIVMYDAYDSPISSETIKTSFSEVDVSIPVLMKKEIEIKPEFINVPQGVSTQGIAKVTPSKLEIAGPKKTISEINSVSLPEIDFTSLSAQNHKFDLSISLPTGCKSLNNDYSAKVDVDMSQFKEKILSINRFSIVNTPKNKFAKVYNGSINVTFIGPVKSVNALKVSDVVAQVDLSSNDGSLSSMEMPVKLIIENFKDIWVYEKHFVNVSLTNTNK